MQWQRADTVSSHHMPTRSRRCRSSVSRDSEIKINYSNPFTSGFLFGMGFGIAMLVMLAILIAIFAVAWFVVLKH